MFILLLFYCFTILGLVNVEAGKVFGVFILCNLELDSAWDLTIDIDVCTTYQDIAF